MKDRLLEHQFKWNITYLVFIQFAIFKLLLALGLEGNNDETDKDVHHEEGDDNNVNDIVDGDPRAIVDYWTLVHTNWVYRVLEYSASIE